MPESQLLELCDIIAHGIDNCKARCIGVGRIRMIDSEVSSLAYVVSRMMLVESARTHNKASSSCFVD